MTVKIRAAIEADAADAIGILHRSITELCVADHQNDPAEIKVWLENKTKDSWRKWIARVDAIMLVAEREEKLVGVGMASLNGEVMLNYVHPGARFCGVSKALLAGMEEVLKSHGVQHCRLESTITAQSFYESCGFQPSVGNALMFVKLL